MDPQDVKMHRARLQAARRSNQERHSRSSSAASQSDWASIARPEDSDRLQLAAPPKPVSFGYSSCLLPPMLRGKMADPLLER